ncbi:sensor histidine kinase [Alkalibaculum sporogenes]|uniref:sensor histidine kinase n=1 Tax=Alkalibaculum sporogenes TaxID=2655001 RepID=UPI001A9B8C11|nr:GHKL domain-containing protein [Alkalibaculum sporogenes]
MKQALYFHRNSYSTSFLFIVCLVFIIINIVIFYYYLSSNQFYLQNKEQEIINIYLKANQKYVNEVENQSEYLHKIWHDLNNHVKNLELLVDNHSSSDALNYLQSIKNNIDKIPNKITTGNKIVDVVLNRKNADIIINDIKFNVKAAIAPQLNIEETDLSAILFNSIDNAIEASLHLKNKEDRLIEIELYHKKQYVYYQIRNNVNALSSKNQRGFYNKKKYIPTGYGLVILQDITDKYNGNLEYGVQDGQFVLTIYLLI